MNDKIQLCITDVQVLKEIISRGLENCLVLMRDKSIDLDERWKLFEEIAEFLPIDSYGADNGWGDKEISEYDHFYTERRETVKLVTRFEFLDEQLIDYVENGESLWYDQADLNAWREQILQDGRQGFIYDW